VEIAVVDVLMEFQPKENMFLQQHDLEPENSERAIILFVPPVSRQFKEINRALDAIQATATAGLVADLDVQMPSKKRSWDSAFTDKKSADEPPVILHLDRKIVPISSIKVIDNMKPPTIFVVQSSDVGKDLVFSAMPSQEEHVKPRRATMKKMKEKKVKESPLVDDGIRRRTRGQQLSKGIEFHL
jgi:23S rRNA A2030 N6-methylase RlmJ